MKKAVIPMLLVTALLLSGCGDQKPVSEATATPQPIGLDIYTTKVSSSDSLSSKLSNVCAPYESILSLVAALNGQITDYCIPGQILADAARDATSSNTALTGGRYSFSIDKGGDYSYTVWGQDIIEAMETPVPDNYDYSQQSGDHMEVVSADVQNAGGGIFSTRYVYDIAADGQSGAIEIYSTLDGQINGHERFDYVIHDGYLCFTDAALDAFQIQDGSYPYIIVCGVIGTDELYTISYSSVSTAVGVPSGYPSVNKLNRDTIMNAATIDSSLSVRNGKATEAINGKFTNYTLR